MMSDKLRDEIANTKVTPSSGDWQGNSVRLGQDAADSMMPIIERERRKAVIAAAVKTEEIVRGLMPHEAAAALVDAIYEGLEFGGLDVAAELGRLVGQAESAAVQQERERCIGIVQRHLPLSPELKELSAALNGSTIGTAE